MSGRRSRPADRSPRRRWILGVLIGLAVVLVGLALLAIPLLGVPGDAQAARSDLTEAKAALQDGDTPRARELVASAREHVDDARGGVQGLGGDAWSVVPVAGPAVDDARHLVQALDDATAVAEIGVDVYPSVGGKQATLFRNEKVDLPTLKRVTSGVREAGAHLTSAEESLDQVEGTSPLVGDALAEARDAAAGQVTPLADGFRNVEPLLDELPGVFGFEGQKQYLIALLNPSDLRYSGGTPLAFAPMTWQEGAIDVGDSVDLSANPRLRSPIRWPRVEGNYFHYRAPMKVLNSTFAPSWSVSGDELTRGWNTATGDQYDGVLAIDLVAFADLLEVTGGITVPGHGDLTSDNLVEKLVGSYDDYYPDPSVLDQQSEAVIPAFEDKVFADGDFVAKAQALGHAAAGRHVAFYSRTPSVEEGMAAVGLDGDLATPQGDYVGVFSQNTNASKADYWQQRLVDLEVRLDPDGTAVDRLAVRLHNDTPPYAVPGTDPRENSYWTRWAGMALSVFLPDGVSVDRVAAPGEKWSGFVGNFYQHDFIYQHLLLAPQARASLKASYRVPGAASVSDDGDLTYRLAMDPQALVRAQQVNVTVHLPEGYRASDLPEGWTADGDTLTYAVDDLASSAEWEITLEGSN